jgi:hypothetical protein
VAIGLTRTVSWLRHQGILPESSAGPESGPKDTLQITGFTN